MHPSLARAVIVLGLLAGTASADDAAIGAAIGAGGQGAATYGAVELRLDLSWTDAHVGLGARGVWLDGEFRRAEWARAIDALAIVRDASWRIGPVAIAAGGLAPSTIAHVVDGYRAALDDRPRTGLRLVTDIARVEIDDVLDPAVIAGAATWWITRAWGVHVAAAVDPSRGSALELGGARRWGESAGQLESGAAIVVEPGLGASAVASGSGAIERRGVRVTLAADLRAGTGTVGGAFGPLYRAERALLGEHAGAGAGLALGAATRDGWITAGGRMRPGLDPVGTLAAGAPMGRYLQAVGWLAATRHDGAGAAELRVAWARRLFSAVQLARMISSTPMGEQRTWSLVAWFGATSD